LFIGPVAIGTIHEWAPDPGSVVSWHASPAARAKAQNAPISAVPAGYMQAQHLRGFCEYSARGLDYSRLFIVTSDVAGRADIRAMSYVINAHLRRHDTYRSWFEYRDVKDIVRRTIQSPADISFVPTKHGEMTPAQIRDHILATPDPLQWDCFTFGIIQRADHFTLYISIDHLHVDAQFVGVVLMELHMMYAALVAGGAPIALPDAGSYDEYCVRQHRYTAALTLESPEVRAWTQFAENNNGTLPDFPLPLGDRSVPSAGSLLTVELMDEHQTARFESACIAAGARFIGGVFACAALAEQALTGADTYYGLTPTDTRSPTEGMTLGWFTGLSPITVPVAAMSFADVARAAQTSFDWGTDVANAPFDRVLELAPWLRRPGTSHPLVNFFDTGLPPLSAFLTAQFEGLNIGLYGDGRLSDPLLTWVIRLEKTTVMAVLFPNNPIARESVARYAAAIKSAYLRAADGHSSVPLSNVSQA
jgi:mycolipenoyl-CoA---2-(long-chain-fatty acyl)-trehalose mycolipenoyltransferase / long-chain-acyl-CoA---trehalose acyltransferase